MSTIIFVIIICIYLACLPRNTYKARKIFDSFFVARFIIVAVLFLLSDF